MSVAARVLAPLMASLRAGELIRLSLMTAFMVIAAPCLTVEEGAQVIAAVGAIVSV